jgi:hypothetical protein
MACRPYIYEKYNIKMQTFLRFEVLPSALQHIQDSCNIMPCGLVNIYWRFEGP